MNENNYNGWKNYETWLVNLWLTNYGSDNYIMNEYREICGDLTENDLYNLANHISQYLDDLLDTYTNGACCGLINDLLNASIGNVDFYEIAESWLED